MFNCCSSCKYHKLRSHHYNKISENTWWGASQSANKKAIEKHKENSPQNAINHVACLFGGPTSSHQSPQTVKASQSIVMGHICFCHCSNVFLMKVIMFVINISFICLILSNNYKDIY